MKFILQAMCVFSFLRRSLLFQVFAVIGLLFLMSSSQADDCRRDLDQSRKGQGADIRYCCKENGIIRLYCNIKTTTTCELDGQPGSIFYCKPVEMEIVTSQPLWFSSHRVSEDGLFTFNSHLWDEGIKDLHPNKENVELRGRISEIPNRDLPLHFPEIDLLEAETQRFDHLRARCIDYAFLSVLQMKERPPNTDILSDLTPVSEIIKKYFNETRSPQSGDLVVYFQGSVVRVHYGIFQEDGRIRSKWGMGPVLAHPIFHVPNMYGNQVKFYRLRADLNSQSFLKHLQEDYAERHK